MILRSKVTLVLPGRRSGFTGHCKKDINVKSEIGVLFPSSFDGKDSDELCIEQTVQGKPEYSQRESGNTL